MKKLSLLITVCFIGIYSYAEYTDIDRANLALSARELEEIEDNSYPFFALDWVTLFQRIDNIDFALSELPTISDYTYYIFEDVRSLWFDLINYLPGIQGELNNTSINSFNILNELYSIREHQWERLDIPLSGLKPESYKPALDTTIQELQSINNALGDIYSDGLSVYLQGDPHITAHIEDMPDINVNTAEIEEKIEKFNQDFEDYVDSFEGQSVYIPGTPLWSNLNPADDESFSMTASRSHNGSFFENLIEMIAYLHLQNASLNKSSYLTYRTVSGKDTEEEREQYEEDFNNSISDIKGRMSELKLEVQEDNLKFNFEENRGKLEIDEIFRQFPKGSNPQSVLFHMPSFGDFPAQTIQVDISALSSFIEKLRIFVRLSYVILLAFVIWSLYKWVFPLLLFLVNFIKKLVSIQ